MHGQFLTLLRAMAASLDLEEIEGLRPMAHIPKDEREKLVDIRERACQLLANRIQVGGINLGMVS